MEETATKLNFSIPASRRDISKDASSSRWRPTPFVKKTYFGTKEPKLIKELYSDIFVRQSFFFEFGASNVNLNCMNNKFLKRSREWGPIFIIIAAALWGVDGVLRRSLFSLSSL